MFKSSYSKDLFGNMIRVLNSFDADQAGHCVESLIWVLTICKVYQQVTNVSTNGEKVKLTFFFQPNKIVILITFKS